MDFYIYLGACFLGGFLLAWLLKSLTAAKIKKENKSLKGLLESERLMKETTQKENTFLLRSSDSAALLKDKLKKAEDLINIMDSDILLLQKSNEETESLLEAGAPMVHSLKVQLIETQNTIARYKAQMEKISQVTS